jgi:hypothetical protein
LWLYDMRGRLVRRLFQGWQDGPQRYEVPWDGTDDLGRLVGSGVYLSRLEAGSLVESKKMVLVR